MGTQTLLPIPFLRQLIRFYGDSIEKFVPSYLQVSLETLVKEQERFRKQFAGAFTPAGAFEAYQEQARKNLAMFEQAMAMFSPFGPPKTAGAKPGEEAKKAEPAKSGDKPPAAKAARSPSSRPSSPTFNRSSRSFPTTGSEPAASRGRETAQRSRLRADRQIAAGNADADGEAGDDVDHRRRHDEEEHRRRGVPTTRNSTRQATNTSIDRPWSTSEMVEV